MANEIVFDADADADGVVDAAAENRRRDAGDGPLHGPEEIGDGLGRGSTGQRR